MRNTFKPMLITSLMLVMLFTSYVALANEYGSKDDPLVSLSYINEVLMPETLSDVESIIDEKTAEYLKVLDDRIADFSDEFDVASKDPEFIEEVSEKLKGQSLSAVVSLKDGETIEFTVGSEVILTNGSGKLSAGFLNVTAGQTTLDNEDALTHNMYVAVEDGKIFTSNSDAEVLVIGGYSLN